jgi:hypothetical protein
MNHNFLKPLSSLMQKSKKWKTNVYKSINFNKNGLLLIFSKNKPPTKTVATYFSKVLLNKSLQKVLTPKLNNKRYKSKNFSEKSNKTKDKSNIL